MKIKINIYGQTIDIYHDTDIYYTPRAMEALGELVKYHYQARIDQASLMSLHGDIVLALKNLLASGDVSYTEKPGLSKKSADKQFNKRPGITLTCDTAN